METTDLHPYLSGEKFSNSYSLGLKHLPGKQHLRIPYLAGLVKAKKVIHVGCVDHLPLIHEKIEKNIWLHQVLSKQASRCLGLDINAEGIRIMKKLGYTDVLCADMILEKIPSPIANTNWDFLIMGEILEHVDDPVQFLKTIHTKYGAYTREIIITVPNAFHLANFINSLKGQEQINSDHRYWFSPYTLMKVLKRSGYHPGDPVFVDNYGPGSRFRRFMHKKYPLLRETLVIRASFGKDPEKG